jgi:transcription antitermination factor NusG
LVDLPFHVFSNRYRNAQQRETIRSWLPGYLFVEFDVARDDWGQLKRIPGVIEILGAPTPLPEGQLEELISRLPTHLERTADDAVIPVGAEVWITAGAFAGREGDQLMLDGHQS